MFYTTAIHQIRGHFDHLYQFWYSKKSLFSVETVRVNVLSKQIYLQNFQERCAQHGAFQRTTRNIKHRTTSYIGTLKTRVFWSKRAQIESKNHDNVVNIVLYWTFLGLSAPYEVAERSCAIFCILIYFTGYKINMCVGTESVTVFNAVTGFSLVWGLRLWLARNRNYSWIWWGDGR